MSRLSDADRRAVRALAGDIDRRSDATPAILPHALQSIQTLIGSEKTLAYGLEARDQGAQLTFLYGDRAYPKVREEAAAWFARRIGVHTAYNLAAPERWQRNRALLVPQLIHGSHPMFQELFPRIGLDGRDQLRVLVCDGPLLLAWVGGFRPERFGVHEQMLLSGLVPSLRRRLSVERDMGDAELNSLALAAALEQIAAPAFVCSATGSVRHVNQAGRCWIERRGAGGYNELAEICRVFDRVGFRVTRLSATGMQDHYLVVQRAQEGDTHVRVHEAARVWSLTARQREVLELLIAGEPNKGIAAHLRCTVRTVELHVSAILDKAQLENRASLVASVWSRRLS